MTQQKNADYVDNCEASLAVTPDAAMCSNPSMTVKGQRALVWMRETHRRV